MKHNYIGISNSFHDGSIAIVDEHGTIVFAEAAERYLQNKRAINNPPDQFIRIGKLIERYCDPDAELILAQSWSRDMQENLLDDPDAERFENFISGTPSETLPSILLDQYYFQSFCRRSMASFLDLSTTNLEYELGQSAHRRFHPKSDMRYFDHHLTHAATACFTSPFDRAACAVIDGYGEHSSYNSFTYEGGKIRYIDETMRPDPSPSLGSFFMMVCKLCGFGLFQGEEWKVMGLAAYGTLDTDLYTLLKSLVRVEGLQIVQGSFSATYKVYRELEAYRRECGAPPIAAANLAHTGQRVFAETVFEFLQNLHETTGMENVVLGGGCMLNSSANGGIVENTGFKQAAIYSAPADDGNSIGAALLAFYQDHPEEQRSPAYQSPYLGTEMSTETLGHLQAHGGFRHMQEFPGEIYRKAAELLAAGKIVGWVQGRSEFGPRALGNRSILADPRSAAVKDIINANVKRREEFRPFAPAILHEYGPEYFEGYQESPYMERTLRFRPEVRERVPGVVHADGTGRLQTVKAEWNEPYHKLLTAFHRITGIPILLNTSFNVMGKPIIHSVEDAVAVFCTSGLDAMVIHDFLIEK
jgi:carbamoyltransferase